MIFAVDIDEVLLQTADAMCCYFNRVCGTNLVREELTSFHFSDVLNLSQGEVADLIYHFHFSPEHDASAPVHGAKDALIALGQHGRVVSVTARPPSTRAVTLALLEVHYSGIFSDHYFVGRENGDTTQLRTKGDVCAEIDALFMVEDALHHAEDIVLKGTLVYLMDTPWNRSTLPPRTLRMLGWKEVVPHALKRIVRKY
jgi:uncharacterized HAD superfamily protein